MNVHNLMDKPGFEDVVIHVFQTFYHSWPLLIKSLQKDTSISPSAHSNINNYSHQALSLRFKKKKKSSISWHKDFTVTTGSWERAAAVSPSSSRVLGLITELTDRQGLPIRSFFVRQSIYNSNSLEHSMNATQFILTENSFNLALFFLESRSPSHGHLSYTKLCDMIVK